MRRARAPTPRSRQRGAVVESGRSREPSWVLSWKRAPSLTLRGRRGQDDPLRPSCGPFASHPEGRRSLGGSTDMSRDSSDPRLPPGQVLTEKWPVLTYGQTPSVDTRTWTFRCFGLLEEEVSWSWEEFLALPRATVVSDIHCVTHWSRYDNLWEGVPVSEILARVKPKPSAVAVMAHTHEGYTTNIRLEDLRSEDALLAIKHDGKDLEPDHGGPCRLLLPQTHVLERDAWV